MSSDANMSVGIAAAMTRREQDRSNAIAIIAVTAVTHQLFIVEDCEDIRDISDCWMSIVLSVD